jgi:adenylate cyclase
MSEELLDEMVRDMPDAASRERRVALIEYLLSQDCTAEEIRTAHAEQRLALLPLEVFLRRESQFTLHEVAERSGRSVEALQRNLAALRLPRADPSERAFSSTDVEGFSATGTAIETGLSEEVALEMGTVIGQAFSSMAGGLVEILIRELRQQTADPDELALRLVAVAERLMPATSPVLIANQRLHLRTAVAREIISQTEVGAIPGARPMTVAFADLAGFTPLSEHAPLDELTKVATRFADLAAAVAEPPVTLVKMVGDAAMLVAADADCLLRATADLRSAAAAEELPAVHAGVAFGPALSRLGDWYGWPVNVASRVAGEAPSGEIFATADVRERSERDDWEEVGPRRLKGLEQPVTLFRLGSAPMTS